MTARDIYVRGGPGEFYLPVGRLVEGADLDPLNISADGRWVLIRYSRGFGWIRRDLAVWADDIDNLPQLDQNNLTPTSLATDTPTPRPTGIQVAAGEAGAYVRFGPGVNFPYLGAVVSGEYVDPVGRNLEGDWILIRFRDGFGWVSRALLARNVPLGDLPILLPGALTPSATLLASITPTASDTPTRTQTPSQTPTATLIPTNTPVASGTAPVTETPTEVPSETPAPSATLTATLAPSEMPTFVLTNTLTASRTPIPSLTTSPQPSATPTATHTFTSTATETATLTATAVPTETPTNTATRTLILTPTNTASPMLSETATEAATAEVSALQVATLRPSATITRTMSSTPTATATRALTDTPTAMATSTPTDTATDTATETATDTPRPTTVVPTLASTNEATAERTETPTQTRTRRPTINATLTATVVPETATGETSAESTDSAILPAETEMLLPAVTETAQTAQAVEIAASPTVAASETGAATATRTPAAAIVLPTPVSSLPETAAPSAPTLAPEAIVGGLLLLALIVYVGLYWRGLSVADRYAEGFVIQRCPICQQGQLSVETRQNRVLGIPRPRSTVRCDTCRSVLREAGSHRWRYAVDPAENPPIYKRFNGKILDETRLIALENSMPPAPPPIHSPTKPPVFLDDEE